MPRVGGPATSVAEPYGLFIGGAWVPDRTVDRGRGTRSTDTASPRSPQGSAKDVDAAVTAAAASLAEEFPAARALRRSPAGGRPHRGAAGRLRVGHRAARAARRFARRDESRHARPAILRLAAEEGRRLAGETLPFDSRAGLRDTASDITSAFPVGVVAAITPFNDPLTVAVHKVGPALAAGNAVVLKPASATPLSALRLAEDLRHAGLPAGRLNVRHRPRRRSWPRARGRSARAAGDLHRRRRNGEPRSPEPPA